MPPSRSLALTHALHLRGQETAAAPVLDIGELCGLWRGDGREGGGAASASRRGVGVGSDRVQQPFLLSPELSGLRESLFCRMGGNDSIPFCGLGEF